MTTKRDDTENPTVPTSGETGGGVTLPAVRRAPTTAEVRAMRMWMTTGAVPGSYLASTLDGGVITNAGRSKEPIVVLSSSPSRRSR